MAFLKAFIDDSASETGDRRLFLAGYLHRTDAWADFSEAWYDELKAWPSIEYLKASDANSLSGEFDYKQGWNEATRNAKLICLAAIIKNFAPISFQFSVNRRLFEEVLKPVSPFGFRKPHFQLSNVVVGCIARCAVQQGIIQPIEFIFDEQDGIQKDVGLFFEDMIKLLPEDAKKLIDGVPSFKNDRDRRHLPLQAADLLAWHVRREHETGSSLPLADSLLNDEAHIVAEISDDDVRSWADHHSKQPGVSMVQSRSQWREFQSSMKQLGDAGINPARITRPGVYYPDSWGFLGRVLEFVRRLLRRSRA